MTGEEGGAHEGGKRRVSLSTRNLLECCSSRFITSTHVFLSVEKTDSASGEVTSFKSEEKKNKGRSLRKKVKRSSLYQNYQAERQTRKLSKRGC